MEQLCERHISGLDWIGLDSFINVTDWYKNGGCLVMKNVTSTYIDTLHGIILYQWGQQWACQSRQIMGWLVGCHVIMVNELL